MDIGFNAVIDRADHEIRFNVFDWDSDDGPLYTEKSYLGQVSGNSEMRIERGLAADAAEWCRENGHTSTAIEIENHYNLDD